MSRRTRTRAEILEDLFALMEAKRLAAEEALLDDLERRVARLERLQRAKTQRKPPTKEGTNP